MQADNYLFLVSRTSARRPQLSYTNRTKDNFRKVLKLNRIKRGQIWMLNRLQAPRGKPLFNLKFPINADFARITRSTRTRAR